MKQPKPKGNAPVRITYKNGKKHISFSVHNTRLEDWVDKQEIQSRLHISDRTLQYRRTRKQIPYSKFGGRILYYLPGIVALIEDNFLS